MTDRYVQAVHQAVLAICERRKPEIVNWMKIYAPWTDRTGNARQTLWADTVSTLTTVILFMDHGMDYGYWLETRNAGRYAIVSRAVDHWAPIIMRDIQELLR